MSLTVPISIDSEQAYRTPGFIYDYYAARFNYVIDLAADWKNAKCPIFLDEKVDALSRNWCQDLYKAHQMLQRGHEHCAAWLNPPFSDAGRWARYMRHEAGNLLSGDAMTMLCLANSIGTEWYRDVAPYCETEIITPRFTYEHPDPKAAAEKWAARKAGRDPKDWKPAAPSSSMVLIFREDTITSPSPAHPKAWDGHLRISHVEIRNPNPKGV